MEEKNINFFYNGKVVENKVLLSSATSPSVLVVVNSELEKKMPDENGNIHLNLGDIFFYYDFKICRQLKLISYTDGFAVLEPYKEPRREMIPKFNEIVKECITAITEKF